MDIDTTGASWLTSTRSGATGCCVQVAAVGVTENR